MSQSPDSQMGSFFTMSMLVLASKINIWYCSSETCAVKAAGSVGGKKVKENYLPVKSSCKSSGLVWHLFTCSMQQVTESHCQGTSRCSDLVPLVSRHASRLVVIVLRRHWIPPQWGSARHLAGIKGISGWADLIQALGECELTWLESWIFIGSIQLCRLLPWRPKLEIDDFRVKL